MIKFGGVFLKKFDNLNDKRKFLFSIIISIYNTEEYLNEAIDSIINQTIGFEENVQLILIDDGSTDNSKNIAIEYYNQYPENIFFLSIPNQGQGNARNIGLNYVEGEFVNFLDADDYISENSLLDAYNFFKEYGEEVDVVSIPLILFGRVEGQHRLNYKYESTRLIDLEKEPNHPQLSASSAFIRVSSIGDLRFSDKIISSEDAIFVNKILLRKKKLGVISSSEYYYRQRFDQSSTIDSSIKNKRYYNERLKNYFTNLIRYSIATDGYIPSFIQYILAYDFQWLFKLDSLDIFDSEDEIKEFWKHVRYVTDCIGKNAIIHNRNIENRFVSFFMFLRNKEYSLELDESNNLLLKSKNYVIDKLNKHKIYMDHIEIIENNLILTGFIASNFNYDFFDIYAVVKVNGEIKKYKGIQYKYQNVDRNKRTFLDIDWRFCYNFDVKIPIEDGIDEIRLELVYSEDEIKTEFYPKVDLNSNCGLSKSSIYFIKNNKIVLFKNEGFFYILPYKYSTVLRLEYHNLRKILRDKESGYSNAIFIRSLFLLGYPFYKNKNIWLFADRPDVADDNAIQLFKYALSANNKDIKKYFVIDKKSKSYDEIKSLSKNIIQHNSLKHKLLFLFSKKNICSYVNDEFVNPFTDDNIQLYAGLVTSEQYFLQHGIIKDDVSLHINRYKKNLRLFLTSSDLERDSIVYGQYNFGEDVVQALGLPRYDNLEDASQSKKQIVFMPTWRMGIVNEETFLESDYFKELSFLVSNEKISGLLKDKGYQLVFKPHPELLKYIDLVDINDDVKLAIDEKYKDLFNNSSLLITDYSSVFFDFAYLKKPVIYFQSNEYHYEEGYFSYETMGFGDVVQTNEELLEKIKYYLSVDCQMEKKYQKRVDKFYKYFDKSNSKRVYEWISDH